MALPRTLNASTDNQSSSLVGFQHRQERFLGDFDLADLLLAFFAGGLLGPELPLAGEVAAVALGGHILLDGSDGFAGDDASADGRLNGDLEQVAVDLAAQLLDHLAAAAAGKATMNYAGRRPPALTPPPHSPPPHAPLPPPATFL